MSLQREGGRFISIHSIGAPCTTLKLLVLKEKTKMWSSFVVCGWDSVLFTLEVVTQTDVFILSLTRMGRNHNVTGMAIHASSYSHVSLLMKLTNLTFECAMHVSAIAVWRIITVFGREGQPHGWTLLCLLALQVTKSTNADLTTMWTGGLERTLCLLTKPPFRNLLPVLSVLWQWRGMIPSLFNILNSFEGAGELIVIFRSL